MSKREAAAKTLFEANQKMVQLNTRFTWETVNAGTQLFYLMLADELEKRGWTYGQVDT